MLRLVQGKQADEPIRVCVPGCATGEEVYYLVLLLLRELAAARKHCPLQVFATAIDSEALEVARQGIYAESIVANVGRERLARYFTRVDEASYRVNRQVRKADLFAGQNLLCDPPFSRVDPVSCRNLLSPITSLAETGGI